MIRTLIAAVCFGTMLFVSSIQAAQDGWPALHDVTDVTENDTLNIRAAPDASSPTIGELHPDAQGVEVIHASPDGKWGLINIYESSGWVSLRYLKRQKHDITEKHTAIRSCFGTEPFWTLAQDVTGSGAWITPEEKWPVVFGGSTIAHSNQSDAFGFTASYRPKTLNVDDNLVELTAIIKTETCGDGMSNNKFGYSVDLVSRRYHLAQIYSGCCTLSK